MPGPARAADDADTSSFYKMTVGRLMESLGLHNDDGTKEINYRERPPLVLPPGRDLPPPEKADVALSPAWPKDPDVKRRKLIEQQEKNRRISDEREREQNPLPPDQLAPGPHPRGVANPDANRAKNGTEVLSPSELGYKGGLFGKMFRGKDDDVAQFTGEPPRTELTAPPPGYQTPSPSQPYGVTQAKGKAVDDYGHHGELTR